MRKIGKFLVISATFIGSTLIGYLVILIGLPSAWEAMGNTDPYGGFAMSVAFFFAPIAGLLIGIAGAIWATLTLSRQQAEGCSDEDRLENRGEDL